MKALRDGLTISEADYYGIVLSGIDDEDRPFRLTLRSKNLPEVKAMIEWQIAAQEPHSNQAIKSFTPTKQG